MRFDRVWINGRLATLAGGGPGLGLVDGGAIAAVGGRIAFVGSGDDLPSGWRADETTDLEGRVVTPGLVDCHTHLIFGGDRAAEFEQRLAGVDYETIARAGGGILSTVAATRAASDDDLMASASARLMGLMAEGVTTVEIKSGYGLDPATELRMLRVARQLGRTRPVEIVATLLAAHAIPPEFCSNRGAYIDQITRSLVPQAATAGLADAVDAYCEGIAFTADEVRQVFAAARAQGLPVKVHADQLSSCGGAQLAAEFKALSADHLEWTDEAGVAALAGAGVVAVLLPGAFFTLRESRLPPVAALRRAGVPIAVATDCNPGTSPLVSLLTAMTMAAVQFRLTVDEVIAGVTRSAAQALGRASEIGTLEIGKECNLAIWNIDRPAELVYWIGRNPLHARVWRGQ